MGVAVALNHRAIFQFVWNALSGEKWVL